MGQDSTVCIFSRRYKINETITKGTLMFIKYCIQSNIYKCAYHYTSNFGGLKSTLLLSLHHCYFCETFGTNAVRHDHLTAYSPQFICEVKRGNE
jgi:hypothetical protein